MAKIRLLESGKCCCFKANFILPAAGTELALPKSTQLYRFWICIDAEVAYSLSLHQKPAELLELPELHGAQVTNSEPFDRCSLI